MIGYVFEAVAILSAVRIWSRFAESRHLTRVARMNQDMGK